MTNPFTIFTDKGELTIGFGKFGIELKRLNV
jgi:hypothetical protein